MAQNQYNASNIEASFRLYLSAENQHLSPVSIKNYISDTKHFVAWLMATPSGVDERDLIERIDNSLVAQYIKHLTELQLPSSTFNRRISSLRRFFSFLKEKELTQAIIPSQPRDERLAHSRTDQPRIATPITNRFRSTSKPKSSFSIGQYKSVVIFSLVIIALFTFIQGSSGLIMKSQPLIPSSQKITSGRIFAFNGRLTDRLGNAITSLTPVQFRLYSSQSSHSPLYQTGICNITPDRNGNFSVLIGGATMSPPPPQDTCGGEVSSSLFSEQPSLFLGTTIDTDQEMKPRKQIANVSYSSNSERLQNFSLGTSNASIPYISADGSVILSLESPHLASTSKSGTFTISGAADVMIQSAHAGDITLNATGSGAIRMKTGGSSSDRIYISDSGNVGINTNHPAAFRLEVSGDIGPDLSRAFNLGSPTRVWKDVFADRFCFDGSIDCITSSQGLFNAVDQSDGSRLSVKGDFIGGSSSTSGKTTLDIGGSGTSFALCHSSDSGTDNQGIVDCSSTPTADFAEMYPTEVGAEFGDIMTLGEKIVTTTTHDEIRQLVRASKPYDRRIIGVLSDNYGDFISVGHNISSDERPMPIALKGRVPVKISQSSKPIQVGDYITSSSDQGKGERADDNGMVIGRALESWEPGSVKNKIMVFIGTDMVAQNTTPLTQAAQTITNILTEPIRTLTAEKIVSPDIEVSTLTPPPGKDLIVNLKDSSSRLVVQGAEGKPVTSISSVGDIDTVGTITAKNAKIAETLEAKTIKSDTLDLINSDLNTVQQKLSQLSQSSISSPSSLINSQVFSLISEEALTSHLIVTGQATIASLSVQNAITSLAENLELASQKTISFFKDAVLFTRGGNIVAKGSITTTDLQVVNPEGVSVASISASGSASLRSLQLPESSGSAVLPEGENTVQVPFPSLQSNSHIYITPESERSFLDRPLFVKEKHLCSAQETDCVNYFVVAIGTNNHSDIKFSWLVIN